MPHRITLAYSPLVQVKPGVPVRRSLLSLFDVLPRPSMLRGQLELRLCNRRCRCRCSHRRDSRRVPLHLASSIASQL